MCVARPGDWRAAERKVLQLWPLALGSSRPLCHAFHFLLRVGENMGAASIAYLEDSAKPCSMWLRLPRAWREASALTGMPSVAAHCAPRVPPCLSFLSSVDSQGLPAPQGRHPMRPQLGGQASALPSLCSVVSLLGSGDCRAVTPHPRQGAEAGAGEDLGLVGLFPVWFWRGHSPSDTASWADLAPINPWTSALTTQ